MPKFAEAPPRAPLGTIASVSDTPDTLTHEGGSGFSRDPKSELFLLAVTNMVGEKTFYEDAKSRDQRFESLIHQVALTDPDWIARFVPFLRNEMNMRSASIVMAAELVRTKLTQPVPASKASNRQTIADAIYRSDEPAEMLGYWLSRYGRAIPKPVKRGVADAVLRVYNERNVVKYDGSDNAVRFADVIEIVHPEPKAPWQSALFKYLLDKRHGRGTADPEVLTRLAEAEKALALTGDEFKEAFTADFVRDAELTWEVASSRYGKLDARFWEAMIPNMGIFALVRNLRNFDDTGISDDAVAAVRAKLTDPEVIAKSRMFPIRFYAGHREVATTRWAEALDKAIELSLANVPSLKGRSLILVDISSSMNDTLAGKSKLRRVEAAAIFGTALALRAEKAELVVFNDNSADVPFRKVGSVLLLAQEIVRGCSGGTNTWQAVNKHLVKEHDRVIILTDEQAHPGYYIEADLGRRPLYTFNLAGYRAGHAPSGAQAPGRYVFGGLNDSGFKAIELLEAGKDQNWPF